MCGYETYPEENPKDLDYASIHAHMAFCKVYLESEEVKGYDAIRKD
tara:strand:+ start:208 stop:345 length:138 start_codon:yes stop_codon:yes gene_type:complete